MKRILSTTAAAAAILISGSAMAACPDDVNKLRTDLQNNQAFQQRYAAGRIDRAAYTQLFAAAQTFGNNGLERRCQDVLSGIRELSDKAEAEAPRSPSSAQPGMPRTDRDTGTDRRSERAERLRTAQPIATVNVSWDYVVGADVRNMDDKDLGDVDDVVMEKGKIAAIVIGRGGFLGMGVSHYLVAADKVKIANVDDAGHTARSRVVVIDMTDEQIKTMPRVKKDSGHWVAIADGHTMPPAAAPSAPPSSGTAPVEKAPATPPRKQ